MDMTVPFSISEVMTMHERDACLHRPVKCGVQQLKVYGSGRNRVSSVPDEVRKEAKAG